MLSHLQLCERVCVLILWTCFFSLTSVDKAFSEHLGFSDNHFYRTLKSIFFSFKLGNICVKLVVHEHHYLLLADKETNMSVNEESSTCPQTPLEV